VLDVLQIKILDWMMIQHEYSGGPDNGGLENITIDRSIVYFR